MSIHDIDSHKLMYHPDRVAIWMRSKEVFPLHAEVGITNRCNHKCVFCTLDWITHGKDDIDKEVMLRTIDEMANCGVKSIYFAGEGEPLLHKDIATFIIRSHNAGMKVSLSTNGSMLTEELADQIVPYLSWIRFSVDAGQKETYGYIHGTNIKEFDKIMKNIQYTAQLAKHFQIQVGVQLVLIYENLNEVLLLAAACRKIGVHNFQVKPCHNHPKSSYSPKLYEFSYKELDDKLKKLETEDFKVILRTKSMERLTEPRNYKSCFGFSFYALIDARGNIIPCNLFYNEPEFYYGNLYQNSFEEIWFGQRRLEVISKINKLNHQKCGDYRCRLDVINRYLWRIVNPEINDEFI